METVQCLLLVDGKSDLNNPCVLVRKGGGCGRGLAVITKRRYCKMENDGNFSADDATTFFFS